MVWGFLLKFGIMCGDMNGVKSEKEEEEKNVSRACMKKDGLKMTREVEETSAGNLRNVHSLVERTW